VLTEISASGSESPDAIGYMPGGWTTLIECKASRADFRADQEKSFRRYPNNGLGDHRFYLTPSAMLNPNDLPSSWGLLELGRRCVKTVKQSDHFEKNYRAEQGILVSAMRRIKMEGHRGMSIKHYSIETKRQTVLFVIPDEEIRDDKKEGRR
jgi:hypothetical protein